MNILSELFYLCSIKKTPELLRKLLRKNPRWRRGHLLLAKCNEDPRTVELSLKAADLLKE